VALIAIEEHWNLPAFTSAVTALPFPIGSPRVRRRSIWLIKVFASEPGADGLDMFRFAFQR
jgi:hypothetical protein